MRHSIKLRMAVATAMVVTLIIVLRALYSQYYAYHTLKELLQNHQDSQVRMVAEQLDGKFEIRASMLRHMAQQFAPMLGSRPAELRRMAAQMPDLPDTFNAVFMAAPSGEMIFSTAVPEGVRMSLSDRDYFRAIVRGAPFAVSDLLQGKLTRSPGVVLAVPLRGPGGELRAVLGGVINLSLDNFLRELARSPVGVTGSYCLVSAGPRPRYAMHRDPAKLLTPARAIGETCGADQPESFWEPIRPRRPIVGRYLLESNGWELVAVLPANEAYAPLIEARRRMFAIVGLSLLVAGALMWLAMWRLLAPLHRLHRAVRGITANPAAIKELPVGREDEIGELASTFAEVMHQLSEREAALKAAKDHAAESEKRIEAIANHVPDFVSFIDMNERFVFVNQAYARHFGLPAQQIIGLTLRELWGTQAYLASRPYLEQALAGKVVRFTRESPDGSECMQFTCQPAWNDTHDAIHGMHLFARNVTSERQKLRSLEAQTVSDHLTGLLNRKGFDRRFAEALARADDSGQAAALLLVDLDDFKAVNDGYGHSIGDRLLVAFAQRLTRSVRKNDAVARIGGDEFAVILENVGDVRAVERIASTIVQTALAPVIIDGHEHAATVSVGSAIHRPGQGMSVSELFMRADMALYEAKRHGKARYAAPLEDSTA
ncbi:MULTISPECIES: sensor domain-containing diguanylate cyclase [Cupriavidus]|nr:MULTISPECIES: diguanylate cyclase [Cupriavidus]